MIDGKKVLAIIPARGGSKGLPGKNIKILGDKPLIGWTIEAALGTDIIDRAIVTTDCVEIAKVARECGAEIPFMRPKELGTDESTTADVVFHAIKAIKESFDIIVLLQPTSPYRTAQHIKEAFEVCKADDNYSLVSVSEMDKSPCWCFWRNKNQLEPIIEGEVKYSRRQDLQKAYVLNGAIYIVKAKNFMDKQIFLHTNSSSYVMNKESSIDIDDWMDFKFAQLLLGSK